MNGHTYHTYSKSMDQPGKVANPARGQLNRENEYFPVRVRAWEFGLTRRVRLFRPASVAHLHTRAKSGAYLRGSFRVPRRRPFFYLNRHTPSGQSRVYRVAHLRTDGVHCRESTGTGAVNIKIVQNECCLGRSPWTN